MAKRQRIKGGDDEVREKNTSAGKKGIIRKGSKKSMPYIKAKEAIKRLRSRT
tara:strand:+ start:9077 stop:9232 length:156 start_codon:yes stop_codon:yes gene_type:complete